jgi:hypothetical protein
MAAHKDEGQSVAAAGLQGTSETEHPDFATAARKRFEHLRAVLALRDGHVVHELAEGGFMVCWRGLSRECRDLAELEQFSADARTKILGCYLVSGYAVRVVAQ